MTLRPWALRVSVALGWLAVAGLFAGSTAGCGGIGVRSKVSVGPRLAPARLGSIRCAMTYDGDWLGGMPPADELHADLELAARRGVDFVIDLRSSYARGVQPLDEAVKAAGLSLVTVSDAPVEEDEAGEAGALPVGLSAQAVDEVRRILNAPGRRRSLLIDENGTRASMVYAIHLAVDEGIAEAEALRAARATGMNQVCADFVHEQVERIRSNS